MIDELSKCQKANFIFEPSLVPVILSLSVQHTNLILERKITYTFGRNWLANNCLDAKMGFTDHEYIQPLIPDSMIIKNRVYLKNNNWIYQIFNWNWFVIGKTTK